MINLLNKTKKITFVLASAACLNMLNCSSVVAAGDDNNAPPNLANLLGYAKLSDYLGASFSTEIDTVTSNPFFKNEETFKGLKISIKPIIHSNEIVHTSGEFTLSYSFESLSLGLSSYFITTKTASDKEKPDLLTGAFSLISKLKIHKNFYLRSVLNICIEDTIKDNKLASTENVIIRGVQSILLGSKIPITEDLKLIGEVGYSYLLDSKEEHEKNLHKNGYKEFDYFGLEGFKGNAGVSFNISQLQIETKATFSQKTGLSYAVRAGVEGDWWSLSLGKTATISFAEIAVKF